MKLPNWFKIAWWVFLIILVVTILFRRYEAISTGESVPSDVFILIIFVTLMLVPIFSEIEFFGVKLRKEIDDLKTDIKIRFGEINNEIRTTQGQTLNQTIQAYGQFGPPPPDSKLPEIEDEIDRLLKVKFEKEDGISTKKPLIGRIEVPVDNLNMFKIRYTLEMQLRRIWEQRFDEKAFDQRYHNQPLTRIIQDLSKFEIINDNLYGILREILSICNYAIHGEKVTDNQVNFVAKNAKYILDYLSGVK